MLQAFRHRSLTTIVAAVFLSTTFSAAFVVPNLARAEVIIVEACRVGLIELRSGDHVTCIDPNNPSEGGEPNDPSLDEYDDGGIRGGSRRPPRQTRQELQRRRRCKQCQAASQACQAQADMAATTCRANAEAQAQRRCDPVKLGANTVTAWGCRIWDHVAEQCAGVGAPWDRPSMWGYECRTDGGVRVCEGRGIDSCVSSWRLGHRGGSTTISTSGEASVTFEGVGAQATRTATTTYEWNGRSGFLGTCATLGMNLDHVCTSAENACYAAHSCTQDDLQ
ncbi:MAG: hypothetical protein F9K40_04510 [Kofleriaceae bacterium]|nr:MAG: hypothetical protein F9K40_04510 [Kofleriaceae bacterium]MBZ0235558.1 hypothetical protein [Kofleriaceae bacterium]